MPDTRLQIAALSHNTIRGAAGCSIMNAELLAAEGYIEGFKWLKPLRQPNAAAQLVVLTA